MADGCAHDRGSRHQDTGRLKSESLITENGNSERRHKFKGRDTERMVGTSAEARPEPKPCDNMKALGSLLREA